MRNKIELTILITILLVLGIGTTIYKINVLGFSFSPDKKETIWTVESRVNFQANGGPVKISLNLPDNSGGLVTTESLQQTKGYKLTHTKDQDGVKRIIWSREDTPKGPQHFYYRVNIFRRKSERTLFKFTDCIINDSLLIFSSGCFGIFANLNRAAVEVRCRGEPTKTL